MPKITIRPATKDDVEHVAVNLRKQDVIELTAAQQLPPADCVRASFEHADWTAVVLIDDVPAILYGVSPANVKNYGLPWMLATDGINAISREFLQGSKGEVDKMHAAYPFLFNQVHCQNSKSIKWLEWLGFIIDRKRTGPQNEFFNFWMGVPNV